MSKQTTDPSPLKGWFKAAGIGVSAVAGMIALVLAYWILIGAVVAALAWIAFAVSAPALGVTFLNLLVPGATVAAIASFLVGRRG